MLTIIANIMFIGITQKALSASYIDNIIHPCNIISLYKELVKRKIQLNDDKYAIAFGMKTHVQKLMPIADITF
jgi:hypothetical protein